MAISNIPILSMLRTSMLWHQERQRLLAENVANSDTPNFQPKDLAPPKFDQNTASFHALGLARTDRHHLVGASGAGEGNSFQTDRTGGFKVRPDGNSVSLEDQMMKVAAESDGLSGRNHPLRPESRIDQDRGGKTLTRGREGK